MDKVLEQHVGLHGEIIDISGFTSSVTSCNYLYMYMVHIKRDLKEKIANNTCAYITKRLTSSYTLFSVFRPILESTRIGWLKSKLFFFAI